MSQQIALRALVERMQDDEETVITSIIADGAGMTRSTIVSGLLDRGALAEAVS